VDVERKRGTKFMLPTTVHIKTTTHFHDLRPEKHISMLMPFRNNDAQHELQERHSIGVTLFFERCCRAFLDA
jgi:hypothetical protein